MAYIKTIWDENTDVTPTRLQNIEDGIEQAHNDHTSYKADYEYQTPTIVGTQIRLQRQSDTRRLHFKLENDLSGGDITISLDNGLTSKPLIDIEGEPITELSKGFVEVVEYATNFTYAPRGGGVKSIQQINYAMDAADKEINISINPVNLNKAVVIADIQYSVPSTGTPGLEDFCQIKIISPTTVRLKKYGGGSKVEGTFYVVEFDGLKSLQVIEQSLNISRTYSNISIAAINPSKSLLFFTYSFGGSGGYQDGVTHGKILNANTLAFRNGYPSSIGVTEHLVCYVAEFK